MVSRGWLAVLALGASACRLVFADGGGSWDDGWGDDGAAGSTSEGGAGDGGGGSVAPVGGAGQGGGAPESCIPAWGEGYVESECDAMDVSAITTCPNTMLPPYAVDACHRSFALWSEGAREAFVMCLRDVPADLEVACYDPSESATLACVSDVYGRACPSPEIDAFCEDTQFACDGAGQPSYDEANCKLDLSVFGQRGIEAYVACFNEAPLDVSCSEIHDYCMNQLTAF